jgi:hypothetical protein
MSEKEFQKPLGDIYVDLGKGNRAVWKNIILCPDCGKKLDQNTEVFGTYRKHNERVGILEFKTCCSRCNASYTERGFVRASRFNGPLIELSGENEILKPKQGNGLRSWLSWCWFLFTTETGLEPYP